MSARFAEIFIASAILIGAGLMLHEALGIGAPAQVFPVVVLLAVVGLTGLWLARLVVAHADARAFLSPEGGRRRELLLILGNLLVFALVMRFDFALAAFLFTATLTAYLGRQSGMRGLIFAVIWAGILAVFVAFAFRYWLNVALSAGLGW